MNERLLGGLILVSALGCGLIGGVFFAFSSFVMTALVRLQPAHGIAAMQSINIAVINPMFLGPFLGTAAVCGGLVVRSVSHWSEPRAVWLMAGGLIYLVGTVLVTMAFNVPRNDALATLDPSSTEAATLWVRYVDGWTAWNHVRTAAAVAAAACLAVAWR